MAYIDYVYALSVISDGPRRLHGHKVIAGCRLWSLWIPMRTTGGATKHCYSNGSIVTGTFWLEEKPTLGRIYIWPDRMTMLK